MKLFSSYRVISAHDDLVLMQSYMKLYLLCNETCQMSLSVLVEQSCHETNTNEENNYLAHLVRF